MNDINSGKVSTETSNKLAFIDSHMDMKLIETGASTFISREAYENVYDTVLDNINSITTSLKRIFEKNKHLTTYDELTILKEEYKKEKINKLLACNRSRKDSLNNSKVTKSLKSSIDTTRNNKSISLIMNENNLNYVFESKYVKYTDIEKQEILGEIAESSNKRKQELNTLIERLKESMFGLVSGVNICSDNEGEDDEFSKRKVEEHFRCTESSNSDVLNTKLNYNFLNNIPENDSNYSQTGDDHKVNVNIDILSNVEIIDNSASYFESNVHPTENTAENLNESKRSINLMRLEKIRNSKATPYKLAFEEDNKKDETIHTIKTVQTVKSIHNAQNIQTLSQAPQITNNVKPLTQTTENKNALSKLKTLKNANVSKPTRNLVSSSKNTTVEELVNNKKNKTPVTSRTNKKESVLNDKNLINNVNNKNVKKTIQRSSTHRNYQETAQFNTEKNKSSLKLTAVKDVQPVQFDVISKTKGKNYNTNPDNILNNPQVRSPEATSKQDTKVSPILIKSSLVKKPVAELKNNLLLSTENDDEVGKAADEKVAKINDKKQSKPVFQVQSQVVHVNLEATYPCNFIDLKKNNDITISSYQNLSKYSFSSSKISVSMNDYSIRSVNQEGKISAFPTIQAYKSNDLGDKLDELRKSRHTLRFENYSKSLVIVNKGDKILDKIDERPFDKFIYTERDEDFSIRDSEVNIQTTPSCGSKCIIF